MVFPVLKHSITTDAGIEVVGTKTSGEGPEILYQNSTLGAIISPRDLISLVESKMKDSLLQGMVIFSGTVPVVAGKLICGTHFRCKLTDPKLKRSLDCEYRIHPLDYLKDMEVL